MASIKTISSFKNQDFADLKSRCIKSGKLFEDPQFPADEDSLLPSSKRALVVQWKRPAELTTGPKLIADKQPNRHIVGGRINDQWLLTAMSCLTLNGSLFHQVVPDDDQSFGKDYAGIFHFRIWCFGQWTDVVVDDRLPVYDNKLVFCQSSTGNEFWAALLEKAYAKLAGAYEYLITGNAGDAMEDLTGGITHTTDITKNPPEFQDLLKHIARMSLMSCYIAPKTSEENLNGLVKDTYYSITGAKKISCNSGNVELVRLRTSLSGQPEWKGAWSDKSKEWLMISDREKRLMQLEFKADGEFWMTFAEMRKLFTNLEVCTLHPECSTSSEVKNWNYEEFEGGWVKGLSAGGCGNFAETFATNPQYQFTLKKIEQVENPAVVIELMQHYQLSDRNHRKSYQTIGFAIYLVDKEHINKKLDINYIKYHASTSKSQDFINSRDNVGCFNLPPGTYAIIPSTFDPNLPGKFLLRLFTEAPIVNETPKTTYEPPVRKPLNPAEDEQMDKKYKAFFDKVAGKDKAVDAFELQKLLETAFSKDLDDQDFSINTCRTIIATYDEYMSGRLNYTQFKEVVIMVNQVHNVYKKYDKDKSGGLDMYELGDSLKDLGIIASTSVLNRVVLRFSSKDGKLYFDSFLEIRIKLLNTIESFNNHRQVHNRSQATYSLDSVRYMCGYPSSHIGP